MVAVGCLILAQFASQATVVTNLNQANLVAAIANGGIVTFSTNGTIALTSTLIISSNTTIDGDSRSVFISGSNSNRIFYVTNNATLTLLNLRIINGQSTNGAGIFNAGGTVILSNSFLSANFALGTAARDGSNGGSGDDGGNGGVGTPGIGGGIYNLGTVKITQCTVFGNVAAGSNGGDGGNGGNDSLFGGNGGRGANGAVGWGGAIYNQGTVFITNSTLQLNLAAGGDGGIGGTGGSAPFPGEPGSGGIGASSFGGAIYNLGTVIVNNSTFFTNGAGGGVTAHAGFESDGGNGGAAYGGGIYNLGSVAITNCTFTENFLRGGKGGDVYSDDFINGGNGGNANGGAIYNSNMVNIVSSTFATNNATGGAGGVSSFTANNGSAGSSLGGNIYRLNGQVRLQNTILAKGVSGPNYSGSVTGIVDGGYNISSDASCSFKTNFLSRNTLPPRLGPLVYNGGISPTMVLLTNSPAINAGDPALNGGTDQRFVPRPQGTNCDIGAFEYALTYNISGFVREGSNGIPGIRIDVAGLTTVSQTNGSYSFIGLVGSNYLVTPRPVGSGFNPSNQVVSVGTNAANPIVGTNATNINFFANPAVISFAITNQGLSNGIFSLNFAAMPLRIYRIQASTNLTNWVTISTITSGTDGLFQFVETNLFLPQRFFRTSIP